MHDAEPIRDVPVVVITPGSARPIEDMENFGPLSRQLVAHHSRHWVHLDEPELVVHTILEMVALTGDLARNSVLQGAD
jgi:hypothetical protein